MPAITLPDGSVRTFDGATTGTAVAASIGPGLARAAVAMSLDASWSISRPQLPKMPLSASSRARTISFSR